MDDSVLNILERMAENGTAPDEGCSLFGVGYEDAFERLTRVYLDKAFARGRSAEKFIVGPFGSGKTHFLRQLMEIARHDIGCATAEITLNRDLDYTKTLAVYTEIARELKTPGSDGRGIPNLIETAFEKVKRSAAESGLDTTVAFRGWVAGLEMLDLEEPSFARVIRGCIDARLADEQERFKIHCRWLSGEVADRRLADEVGATPVKSADQNRFGRRALQSLCQFIRHAQFAGTVIGFDEAEQSFSVSRKRMDAILSMLQSSINATADLKKGAALIVYALTPDVVEKMENFAALQQRVADPGPGQGFFDGNTRAPKIDLTRRDDPARELEAIGVKLVDLLYEAFATELRLDRSQVNETIRVIAEQVARDDAAASNRRTMAKQTCSVLLRCYEDGVLEYNPADDQTDDEEAEV